MSHIEGENKVANKLLNEKKWQTITSKERKCSTSHIMEGQKAANELHLEGQKATNTLHTRRRFHIFGTVHLDFLKIHMASQL